jgi:hypothetical protein
MTTQHKTTLPLYLKGGNACHIDLQGPALTYRKGHANPLRYPLERISRIIAASTINWSGRALHACMEAQIPVVIIDKEQHPAGYIQPRVAHKSDLDRMLRQWIDHPEWHDQINNWQRRQRMWIYKQWFNRQLAEGKSHTNDDFQQGLRRYVQQSSGELSHIADPLYHTIIDAITSHKLQQAGVSARYIGHGGEMLDLRQLIAQLLELALIIEFNALTTTKAEDPATRLRIIHAFTDILGEFARIILGSLHQYARARLEEWH